MAWACDHVGEVCHLFECLARVGASRVVLGDVEVMLAERLPAPPPAARAPSDEEVEVMSG